MGLNTRSFQEILRGMVDWTATHTNKLTDFTVGSAIRTLYEAVSSELELYYFSIRRNVAWGIENSVFETFGFSKYEAIESSGMVSFKFYGAIPSDLRIPAGAKYATAVVGNTLPIYFETREDYYIPAGSISADIEVFCKTKGVIGNVPANTIRIALNGNQFVEDITNHVGFNAGKEAETTAARKQRFNRFVETLAKGTVKSIEYGTKEVDGVTGVWVDESVIGLVRVFAHDASGNLPEYLRAAIVANLVNYRAAGIPVEAHPIIKTEIEVSLQVKVPESYKTEDFEALIADSAGRYINDFPVSKSLYLSDLIQHVRNYDSIAIIDCKVITPENDISVLKQEMLRASIVTVKLVT